MKASKKSIIVLLTILLMWGLAPIFPSAVEMSAVHAASSSFLFTEDFNGQQSDRPPAGWFIGNKPGISGEQSTILVRDIPSADDKSLEFSITNSSSVQDPFVYVKFDQVLHGTVVVEAALRSLGIGTTYQTVSVRDQNNANTVFLAMLERDGSLYAYNGSTRTQVDDEPYLSGEWIPLKMVVDVTSKTYDFYVDGVKMKEGLRLSNQNLHDIQYLRMQTRAMVDGSNAKTYFKDIRVATPGIHDSYPRSGQGDVPLDAGPLKIQFNTPMDVHTLNPDHIVVTNETEREKVNYTDFDSSATSYSFQLPEPLKSFNVYSIQLQGVTDASGNPVEERITFRTTARSQSDQSLYIHKHGFRQDGRLITGHELSPGLVTGEIEVTNLSDSDLPVAFIMALFHQEELVDYTYMEQQIAADSGSERLGAAITVPEHSVEQYHMKMFIWDEMTGMRSLSEPEEVQASPFYRPTADEVLTTLKMNHPNKQHPRILMTADRLADLKADVQTDPLLNQWYQSQRQAATVMLDQPVEYYHLPDGVRLLAVSRAVKRKVETLGLMYLLTEEEVYAERLWDELSAAADFPNWNPDHFLDTAEMTYAFALGYDWLYDYWDDERREVIRGAIIEHGLNPGLDAYRNPRGGTPNRTGWATDEVRLNNWNIVTNSGMVVGALAIADEEEEIAGEILEGGIRGLELSLKMYAPEGAWIEGVSYWAYASRYLAYYLAALDTALGTDYNHFSSPGIDKTAYFPVFLTGPTGIFNFYDDSASRIGNGGEILWFANQLNDAGLTALRASQVQGSTASSAYDVLWFTPEHMEAGGAAELPLDFYFGEAEIATFRSLWDDPYALFVGIHGGGNRVSHSDLDIGNFIIDALGERWAIELGSENYNVPGYWDYNERRWSYYRKRAEGQNTLIINPRSGPTDQNVEAFGEITEFVSHEQGGFAILDMTEAYEDDVWQAQRGIALHDQRTGVLVQDEVLAKQPSEIYWFMHTEADIEISEDGKSAWLTIGDKQLWAGLQSNQADARFTVTDAAPLPSITNPATNETANPGVKRLTIHMTDVTDLQLAVHFVPLMTGDDAPTSLPEWTDLADWSIPEEPLDLPLLEGILLDQEPLEGFIPNKFIYEVTLPFGSEGPPAVEAIGAEGEITVEQSSGLPSKTIVRVSDGERKPAVYQIYFKEGSEIIVTASADDGNVPENTLDGDLSTRWSADGYGQWIQYEFNEIKRLDGVSIAFYLGDQRSTFFDIEVSADGVEWESMYSGQSSGTTHLFERYDLAEREVKFVRIIGKQNTSNSWNSISEVTFHGSGFEMEGSQ